VNEAFSWVERRGFNHVGDEFHVWSLIHLSGRIAGHIYCPLSEIEDYVASTDNDVDRWFWDLAGAKRFVEKRAKAYFRGQLVRKRSIKIKKLVRQCR
jgi:hypothetical protein